MKKKKKTFLAMGLLSGLLLTGCAQNSVDQQAQPNVQAQQQVQKQQIQANTGKSTNNVQTPAIQLTASQVATMKQTLDDQDKQIKALTDEVEYYRSYVKDFTATFSSDKMKTYIDKEWTYTLSVNNVDFPKNGILSLTDKSFTLQLNEQRVKYTILPDEMSKQGKIQTDLPSSLSFESTDIKHDDNQNLGDINSTLTYSFKDIPSNTTIKFKISDDLKAKLKMDTNELQIQVQ
ncbi:hypothetical protein PP175_28205 (plasmid) [Aneurinibacillus sp. Ricciae_BoGa-3]|uniref:hypothetical protein n=1 Tax=Aneurinibacillus sp. Ricciae_BoGa-3 TaxID=3022697 RepID=UPI00233F8E8A|nr:hypothetical protein [Aneurinibacillus sp. Ricciae_BoGa-3]WCK57074.1 hypothetical protein PP175_28205 [Aneurinibacillus sp. Ricciae_BoGa-3]